MPFEDSPVAAWYEAAPANIERMKEILHPDIEFNVCAGWPNGGTYYGHEGVFVDFFPIAAKAWEKVVPEVDEVIEAGDTYVIRGRYVGVARPTGNPFSLDFVHIWRVKDDKLVSLDQIADTAVLVRAATPDEA